MTELLLGLSIGLGAGISPGPLLTFVVTTTLQRGYAAGVRVACSPLLTDGPIIVVVLLFLSTVPDIVVRVLAAAGGLFVIYLGVETVRTAAKATLGAAGSQSPQRDLWQGVLVNVLSPHPWLFWLSVGGPIVVDAWHDTPGRAAAFLAGFYTCLVGSKVALAAAAAVGRRRLTDDWYRRLLLGAGALLVVTGGLLLLEAAR